jgi:hypothetical protein
VSDSSGIVLPQVNPPANAVTPVSAPEVENSAAARDSVDGLPGFNPLVNVVAGPPPASGMFQPPAVVAPVRVLGVEDPAVARVIVDGLAPQINAFYQMAQMQHQMSGREFSHQLREVNGARLRFIANGGQSFVEVTPAVKPVQVVEEPPEEPASPMLLIPREVWVARYIYVAWAGPHRGPGLTTGTVPISQVSQYGDLAVARARGPGSAFDQRFGVLRNSQTAFWVSVQISPTQAYFSTFYWALGFVGFDTREEAEKWTPPEPTESLWSLAVPGNIYYNIGTPENPQMAFWGYSTWVRPPETLPFTPIPPPVKVDVFRTYAELTNMASMLAPDLDMPNEAFAIALPNLNTVPTFVLRDWPDPPVPVG